MNDLYKTICERIKADKDAKREERELMLDDQRFAAGDQWPMQIKRKREIEGRPIQTTNLKFALMKCLRAAIPSRNI